MRLVLRVLGLLLLAVAFGLFLRDLAMEGPAGTVGDVWYSIDPPSLNLLQAGIQRHLSPDLWDRVVVPALLWPAALVALVPGVLLTGLGFLPRRQR